MEKNYSFSMASISAIRAKLTWAQLEILKGSHETIQVHIAGHEDCVDEIRVEHKEQELCLSQPQYTVAKEIVPFKRWIQVCVRVPDSWQGDLDASTVSGTISAQRVNGDDIAFTTVTGSIHVKKIHASYVGIRSVSGAIAAEDIKTKHLLLRTVSGKASVLNLLSVKSRVFTVGADISLRLGDGCKSIDIQSLSGDVLLFVEGPVKETSLRTLSGHCILGEELEKKEDGLDISSISFSGSLTVKGAEAES